MARTADIFTFDIFNTQDDRSIFTELQIYDRLVKLSGDGKSVEPELATTWTIAPDGLSATFTLRDGVKFWDGTPLTPSDVVFSLTRAIDQTGSWGFLFSPVKSVETVDNKTIKINMITPFAPLLPALSTFAASIYSKANFQKWGAQAGVHPLGTGAFMLDHWDKGSQLVLARNPNYWQPGKPYLDKLVFTVVGDDNARVLQVQSGAADVIDSVPPNIVQQIQGSGANVEQVTGSAIGWMLLNALKKPLDDPNVRCAMAWAVDREAIAKNVYFGLAKPAKSLLPSGTFYWDPNASPIGYDLSKAKQLLAKSSVPTGFSITATVSSGDSANQAVAQIWAASLKQIGIQLKIDQVEATTAQDLLNTEKYAIDLNPYTNDTVDPDEALGTLMDYKVQNGLHTHYHSDVARNLVNQARAQNDPSKRAQMYSQLQTIGNTECPAIYTVDIPRLYASSGKVHNFTPNSQGKYSFEDVWKEP